MKRLIKKSENFYDYDDFLGKRVEIVYNKSKFFGCRGYVDDQIRPGNKYRVFVEVYDRLSDRYFIKSVYIKREEAFKWLKIVDE